MKEVRFVLKREDGELIYVVGRASFVENDSPSNIVGGWAVPTDDVESGFDLLEARVVGAEVGLLLKF